MRRKITLVGLFLVLTMLFVLAMRSESAVITVEITASGFNPQRCIISRGDIVLWVNNDTSLHRITSDDGYFDSGVLQPGHSWQFTFEHYPQSGREYPYHDGFDATITGTICIEYCNDYRWYVFLPLVMRNHGP